MGLLGEVFKVAAGVALGSSSSRREEKKQTKLMQEQAEREKERDRKADLERGRIAAASRAAYNDAIRENQKRRQQGLPEIPVPKPDWR